MKRLLPTLALAVFAVSVVFGIFVIHERHVGAQTVTGIAALTLSGMGSPTSNGFVCDSTKSNAYMSAEYIQRDMTGNNIWKCQLGTDGITYAWQAPYTTTAFQNQDWTLQPGLFATGVVKSTVYYEVNAVNIIALTSREEGSPICTAAPVLVLLDLGTSPSTAYGSATVLYSQTLSTSNTVASNTGLSVPIAAGHYLGIGFSAGTCVTPPTISPVATVQ